MRSSLWRMAAAAVSTALLAAGCGGGGGGATVPTTVTVTGKVQSDDTPPQDLQGAQVVLGGKVTTTAADGSFAFNGVEVTGRQAAVTAPLTVTKEQYGTALDDNLQVTPGQTKDVGAVTLPARVGTGSVAGRVVRSTDGAALVNALVTAGADVNAQSGRTADDGTFVLSGVLSGRQAYRVEKIGFLPAVGMVDNVVQGQTTALPADVRLIPTGTQVTVSGTVRDEAGNALDGATVSAGNVNAPTGSNGRYQLEGVSVGTQPLTASKAGFNNSVRQIEVTGQQGEVDFVLFTSNETPPDFPFNLAGIVVDGAGNPVSGATVRALDAGSAESGRFETGADGKFYLFVPAGDYTIRAEKAGTQPGEQQVTLPGGGQIVTGIQIVVS